MAMGHLGHRIGSGGGHDDKVGGTAQLDMAHLGLVRQVEQIGVDLLRGQQTEAAQAASRIPPQLSSAQAPTRGGLLAQPPPDQVERLLNAAIPAAVLIRENFPLVPASK